MMLASSIHNYQPDFVCISLLSTLYPSELLLLLWEAPRFWGMCWDPRDMLTVLYTFLLKESKKLIFMTSLIHVYHNRLPHDYSFWFTFHGLCFHYFFTLMRIHLSSEACHSSLFVVPPSSNFLSDPLSEGLTLFSVGSPQPHLADLCHLRITIRGSHRVTWFPCHHPTLALSKRRVVLEIPC